MSANNPLKGGSWTPELRPLTPRKDKVAEPAWVELEASKPGLWRWPWAETQVHFARGEPRKDAVGSGDGRTTMGEEGALDLQAEAAGLVLITTLPHSEGPPEGIRAPQALP